MDTEKKYNGLKNYLENNLEISVDETELDDIINLAVKQDSWEANRGYKFERTSHNSREMAFYEQWLKENEPLPYLNNGNGILQDLFIEREGPLQRQRWVTEITNRDRMIAATVIQWLGSNCGMCFLNEALKRFNARIDESRIAERPAKLEN